MDIDPRQLAVLLSIAERGSFSGAAAARNMSQPALSASIALLEKRLGVRVLERGRHGATLTEVGRTLLRHARAMEAHLSQAVEEVRLNKIGVEGPLVVGVTPVAAASLVPIALGRLKAESPNISVMIVEGIHDDLIAALTIGEVDLVVGPVGIYPRSIGVAEERLTLDPLAIVVRPDHPVARLRSVSLPQLHDADWVLPSEKSAFRHQLEALFVSAGVQWPAFHVATNSMVALKSVVMHSHCVTIMPHQLVALEAEAGKLSCVGLRGAGHARALGLITRPDRNLSPLAARFADALRRAAKAAAAPVSRARA